MATPLLIWRFWSDVMRILVLGAGGTGGYFGGRLVEAGQDVTFLVRPARAARLAADGLAIRSPRGNAQLVVRSVTAEALTAAYDLVVVSCKAYDLADAIATIAPAMGPQVSLLPLLNGLAHYDALDAAFGAERILGGLCHIAVTLDPAGAISHLNTTHSMTFGERAGGVSDRVNAIAAAVATANFEGRLSVNIMQDVWEKYAFLATLAGMTCLMRASVGVINRTDEGTAITLELLEECRSVAAAAGYAPRAKAWEDARRTVTDQAASLTASMLRDLEAGGRTEGDHILGDMLRRAKAAGLHTPVLRMAVAHLQAYEGRRLG